MLHYELDLIEHGRQGCVCRKWPTDIGSMKVVHLQTQGHAMRANCPNVPDSPLDVLYLVQILPSCYHFVHLPSLNPA